MKHLVFILALLITAPSITCRAQATFKQAFINMPLASESSPDLQPIGTHKSWKGLGVLGGIFLASGTLVMLVGIDALTDPDHNIFTIVLAPAGEIALTYGITSVVAGLILLAIAI